MTLANRPKRLVQTIVVRLPADLAAALQADATANERTVSQSARYHLARALNVPRVTP